MKTKTILIFVSTLDGKVTKWGDTKIRDWSSKQDQDYFDNIWKNTRTIIMGSGTYLAEPVKPDSGHLYIVMTTQPAKYQKTMVKGKLEFTNESPKNLIARLEKENEESTALIVGGPQIATLFLKEQQIDELWLTIEPKIFGSGASLVINEKFDIELKLLSIEKVNNQGTLLTKYEVLNNKE